MKSLRSTMLVLGAGSLMVLTAACAQPPTAQISAAETALNAARDADAPTYAPEAWSTAQEAMNNAKTELAAQDAKFALLRSYSKGQEMLSAAENAARNAELAGTAGREKAQAEAEAALAQVKTDLDAATALLGELEKCPRRPKGFAQDLELLKGNLQGLADSVPEVESALSSGQFNEASTLATTLGAEIATFSEELAGAKTKIKC